MFLNILVSVDYNAILITITVIAIMILILYMTLIILSFSFMHVFKKKINKGKEVINVVLFQKYESLMKISELYKDIISADSPLAIFGTNEYLKKYNVLKAEEFENFYNYSESILNEAKKVFVNYDLEDMSLINEIFNTIEELNKKYFEAIQLYNTNVIGYNYWRDLFSTRWLKNLLFIKKIDTIK